MENEIQNNELVILEAIKHFNRYTCYDINNKNISNNMYKCISANIKNNKQLLLQVLSHNPAVFEFVTDELKDDIDIVTSLLLAKNVKYFQFASNNRKNDIEIGNILINSKCLYYYF
jgi:aspartate/tyrosine/aromatic aminotransferase